MKRKHKNLQLRFSAIIFNLQKLATVILMILCFLFIYFQYCFPITETLFNYWINKYTEVKLKSREVILQLLECQQFKYIHNSLINKKKLNFSNMCEMVFL